MMNDVLGLLISMGPVCGALLWCNLRDRRRQMADRARAIVSAAVNRAMGGESVVGVYATPATPWRAGRIRLSVPRDYEALLVPVSATALRALPARYELVVRRDGAAA